MKYVWKKYPIKIITFAILTILLSGLMVLNAVVLQLVTNFITNSQKQTYGLVVINVVFFILIQTLVYYFQQYYSEYLAKKSINLYRRIIFKRIINQELAITTKEESGKYIALMTSQMDNLEENYFGPIFWGFYLLMQFLLATIVAIIINPIMAIFAVLLSIPNIFLPLLIRKKLEKAKKQVIESTDSYVSTITDNLDGIIDWKVNNGQNFVELQEQLINADLLASQKYEIKLQNRVTALNKIFSDFLYFGTWLLGVFFVINQNLTLSSVVAFAQLITSISFPIYNFSDIFTQLVGGHRLFKEIENKVKLSPNLISKNLNSKYSFNKLSLRKVSVNLNNHEIFNDFSLDILSGKKYLVYGPSGSGKTTFIKLLIKQIISYQGKILLDNMDIQYLTDSDISNLVGYLPQDGHIFSTSLRNNLTLFDEGISDQDIFKVLNFVELKKWANKESLQIEIGKGKNEVSGGEAKRIELARLLLQNKPIFILDEFSSGIDKSTLKKIEEKLFQLPNTIIYITHIYDENLINKADEVIKFTENRDGND